ncbi:MAG: TRAP transporter substrate-binding protein [Dermatophilus congolensis]|nr:TRAP transporter substrate-binding protein [Dermatophilus congolensis]
MKRRTLMAVVTVGALTVSLAACGGGGSGGGAEKTILRLALNQTEKHPSYIALDDFSKRLEAASGGRYTIDIFPNEVLGAQQEILNLQRNGIVDLAIISSTQLENINKDFQVFNLPRVFDSVDHQMKVINDPNISGPLFHSLEKSNNLLVLGGFTQGERNLYTKKAIKTPADMAGQKIRVQESPVMLAMIRAMGGNPTPMAYGEVYTALQANILDGAENNEVSYFTQKHFEVAPIFTYTKHLVGLDYMVASTDALNKMTPEDRTIFDAEWTKTWQHFVELWGTATQEAIDGAKEGGATFAEIDTAPFDEKLKPVAESLLSSDVQKEIYAKTREAAAQ